MTTYKPTDYTYEIAWSPRDEVFIARVVDFPVLAADGDTMEAALHEAQQVVAFALDLCIEDGTEPPKPRSAHTHSGKILLRIPPTIHERLAREAADSDVSLNQLVRDILTWRQQPPTRLPAKRPPSSTSAKRVLAKAARKSKAKKSNRAR